MCNCLKSSFRIYYSQIINKYDSILDVIFIGTKYTSKLEIVLTKFDVELAEN